MNGIFGGNWASNGGRQNSQMAGGYVSQGNAQGGFASGGSWATTGVPSHNYSDTDNIFYNSKESRCNVEVINSKDAYRLFNINDMSEDEAMLREGLDSIELFSDLYKFEIFKKMANNEQLTISDLEEARVALDKIILFAKISYNYDLAFTVTDLIMNLDFIIKEDVTFDHPMVQGVLNSLYSVMNSIHKVYFSLDFKDVNIISRTESDAVLKDFMKTLVDKDEEVSRRVVAAQFITTYTMFSMGINYDGKLLIGRKIKGMVRTDVCAANDMDAAISGPTHRNMIKAMTKVYKTSSINVSDIAAEYTLRLIFKAIKYHFQYDVPVSERDGFFRRGRLSDISNILSTQINPAWNNQQNPSTSNINMQNLQRLYQSIGASPSLFLGRNHIHDISNPDVHISRVAECTDMENIILDDLSVSTELVYNRLKKGEIVKMYIIAIDNSAPASQCVAYSSNQQRGKYINVKIDGDDLELSFIIDDITNTVSRFNIPVSKYQSLEHAMLEANKDYDTIQELISTMFKG